MTLALGFGYLFMAFSPALLFTTLIIAPSATFMVASIASSFFFLVSIMLPSVFYGTIPGFEESVAGVLIVSVLFQEFFRFLFVKAYMKAESSLMKKSEVEESPFLDWGVAVTSGIGFGLMYALVMNGGAISGAFEQEDYADFYLETCPSISVYVMSSTTALLFQILHVALMVLTFHSARAEKRIKIGLFALVLALHFIASGITLLNDSQGGCVLVLPLLGGVVALSWGLVFAANARN